MKRRKNLRFLWIFLVVAAIAGGGYWVLHSRSASPAATGSTQGQFSETVAAKRGNLNASFEVVGALAAQQQDDLMFSRQSDVTSLLSLNVAAGNVVTAGQVLATIDPAPYEQAVDQATSALQEAEENLATLETAATALELSQADVAVAQADNALQQAKKELADLSAPDIASLQTALQNAEDNLTAAQLQKDLAEHESLAKSVRDLTYSTGWHERKAEELRVLVTHGQANKEQTEQAATEADAASESRADLARAQAQFDAATKQATADVTAAQIAVDDARDALETAQRGGDALALAKAKLAVQKAQVSLQEAREKRDDLTQGADANKLSAARADVDKKKLALSEAQLDLAAATIKAPYDGTILSTSAAEGDQVSSSTKILTIANLNSLVVDAAVDEITMRNVQVGQSAEISFDAFPGQIFTGTVLSVPLQGELQGGVMVYQVPVSLEGADQLPLLVGMTANVKIHTGSVENALLIPAMAVISLNNSNQVLVPGATPQDAPQSVPVEIGLSDGTYSQVLKGLNEGDQVLVTMQASDPTRGFYMATSGSVTVRSSSGPR